jgi:hypothetical protein
MTPTDTPADRAAAFYELYRGLSDRRRPVEPAPGWTVPASPAPQPSAAEDRQPVRVSGYF